MIVSVFCFNFCQCSSVTKPYYDNKKLLIYEASNCPHSLPLTLNPIWGALSPTPLAATWVCDPVTLDCTIVERHAFYYNYNAVADEYHIRIYALHTINYPNLNWLQSSLVRLGMPMQRQRGVRGRRFGWFILHSTCMFLYLYAYHVNKTFDFVILNVCSFVWYEY